MSPGCHAPSPSTCPVQIATCFATSAAHGALPLQQEAGTLPAAAGEPAPLPASPAQKAGWALVGAAAAGALALLAMQLRHK